jgi:hypothetical protein
MVKELQATAAFKIRDIYHEKKCNKKEGLFDVMYKSYHGDKKENLASQAEMLFNGQGIYRDLYEEEIGSVTDTNAVGVTRTVKREMTNDLQNRHTVGNGSDDITLRLLKQKAKNSTVAVKGKALYDAAELVHANCKKALAIGEKYLNARKDNPSGTNAEDYHAHWGHENSTHPDDVVLLVMTFSNGGDAVSSSAIPNFSIIGSILVFI